MKKIRFIVVYIATAFALLCLPASANATAIFDASIGWVSGIAPDDWNYQVTIGDPGNANTCLSNGSRPPGDSQGFADLFTVLTLGPPFSGSASRTRYLTTCGASDNFSTVEMTIHLNGCALWICSGEWDFTVVNQEGTGFQTLKDTIWPDNISVVVPNIAAP